MMSSKNSSVVGDKKVTTIPVYSQNERTVKEWNRNNTGNTTKSQKLDFYPRFR